MSTSYGLAFGGLLTKGKGKVKLLKVSGEFVLAESKGLKKNGVKSKGYCSSQWGVRVNRVRIVSHTLIWRIKLRIITAIHHMGAGYPLVGRY